MGRLIDADKLPLNKIDDANYGSNYIRIAPTIEAIPKADYEQRLKADMVTMLTEIQMEIEKIPLKEKANDYRDERWKYIPDYKADITDLIQEKIDSLKEKEKKNEH